MFYLRSCDSNSKFLRITLAWILVLGGLAAAEANEDAAGEPSSAVDYARDIAPIFSQNCIACHNAKKPEGGLNLESYAGLMAGGDSGESVMAKDIEGSYLLARVSGAEEPLMPPEDNAVGAKRLSDQQLRQIEQWIREGAADSQMASSGAAIQWQTIPEHLQPVYALDASPDGNYLAFGRSNQVEIVSQSVDRSSPAGQSLIDPNLQFGDGTQPTAAHLDIVQSIAFSPDSQLMATGGYRSVKLWRRQTAAVERLVGLSGTSRVAAVAPSGNRLAFASGGNGVELVDVESGQAHRFLKLHTSAVTALLWLTDDSLLSSDASGKFYVTRADDLVSQELLLGEEKLVVRQYVGMDGRVFGLSELGKVFELSLAGTNAASANNAASESSDTTASLRWFDLTGEGTKLLASSAPEPRLIVSYPEGAVRFVDPDAGTVAHEFNVGGSIKFMSVSADGTRLLAIPMEGPAQLWKSSAGELLATLDKDYQRSQQVLVAQRDAARQQAMIDLLAAQIPELKKAAEAETAAQMKVQEARDKAAEALAAKVSEVDAAGASVTEAEQAVQAAQTAVAEAMKRVEAMNAELEKKKKAVAEVESKRMEAEAELAKRDQALAAANDSVERAASRVPDMESRVSAEKERLSQLQAVVEDLGKAATLPAAEVAAFTADGSAAVLACDDSTLRVYSTADGLPLANLSGAAATLTALSASASNEITGLTRDGRVITWDLNLPWTLARTIGNAEESPFSDRVTALDFSPDGRWLAVGSGPPSRFGEIKLVDVANGEIAKDLGEVHSDTVLSLRFSPDGRLLASGGADKLCRLFDIESGEMLRAFEGHSHHVLAVAWRDSGQQLATASADNTLKIWTVATGEQQRTISGFSKEVTALEYVGQTSQLVAASADSSVRLYNADDGKQVRSYGGGENALFCIAVSGDNQRLFSGGQAGKVWSWKLDDGKLLETLPKK
jgi:WD40 repeat protein